MIRKNLPKCCVNMPKTFDVHITTLDAELEFSVEVNTRLPVTLRSVIDSFTVYPLIKRATLSIYAVLFLSCRKIALERSYLISLCEPWVFAKHGTLVYNSSIRRASSLG